MDSSLPSGSPSPKVHFLMFAARKHYRRASLRCIMIGDKIPDLTLPLIRAESRGQATACHLPTLFAGQRTLVVAHPGAFTYHSTSRMLPDYSRQLPDLKAAGFTQVLAFSVNDEFVLEAYAKKNQFGMDLLSDWRGQLTNALDLGLPPDRYFAYIARRAIFLVDESATILGVSTEESVQYTSKTAPSSAFAMLRMCSGSPT